MLFIHENIKVNILYAKNMMNIEGKEIEEITDLKKWTLEGKKQLREKESLKGSKEEGEGRHKELNNELPF